MTTRRDFLAALGGAIVTGQASRTSAAQRRTNAPPARAAAATARVQTLQSVAAVPPDIVGAFREPASFQQASSGQFFVLDRLGHIVYGIDRDLTGAWKIVQIGQEAGRVLEPTGFAVAPNGTFVVADRPRAAERVQVFGSGGALLNGFTLPGRAPETVTLDGLVLNGVGSLQYSGRSIFMSQPETGALVSEYSLQGAIVRTFGTLRPTGQEADADVHHALNTGLPLVNPRGGFCFVFTAGVPMFRKMDEAGRLVFERHIEGLELDPVVQRLPTAWPRRKATGDDRTLPVVRPVIRTAAIDAAGNLWVTFASVPFTYVYDSTGERVRVVQFRGAGPISPSSLFFAPDGRLLVAPGCYIFDSKN